MYDNNLHPYSPLDTITCPCPTTLQRLLQPENPQPKLWEMIYSSVVLVIMFVALISDKIGADMVMLGSVTLFMAAKIITVPEGVAGFANDGVLTVLSLFVVAAGIGHTGALDWYMAKLLGQPTSTAAAQLRLMIPIGIVSAFMNNTPVVAIMIPIIQSWSKRIGRNARLLLIPLSFSSILGGTCTLIGTSTNLVVLGLLQERYGEGISMGLFDLGEYGIPILLVGFAYIISCTGCLLENSEGGDEGAPFDGDDILLGARLTKWSPAAGRSVGRSGLRDTGGLFLVSVYRATTGNVHRAVGQDFVLNVGDVLYFTGLVEGFGEFCVEHGLEMVTSDVQDEISVQSDMTGEEGGKEEADKQNMEVIEADDEFKNSSQDRLRVINQMSDTIRGFASSDPSPTKEGRKIVKFSKSTKAPGVFPAKIVVATAPDDGTDDEELILVGVDAPDRPGLLLDISKGLLELSVQLRQTEAYVEDNRSISVWRCEVFNGETSEEEIAKVLHTLMERAHYAKKEKGLQVIRAVVTEHSKLVGRTPAQVNFNQQYKSKIVAIQKKGHNTTENMNNVVIDAGDMLVLQAQDDSPLLKRPLEGFYKEKKNRKDSNGNLVGMVRRVLSRDDFQKVSGPFAARTNLPAVGDTSTDARGEKGDDKPQSSAPANASDDDEYFVADVEMGSAFSARDSISHGAIQPVDTSGTSNISASLQEENAWRDLRVVFPSKDTGAAATAENREFLTAMQIASSSPLINKTAAQSGINKLPGLFLVSIERPPSAAQLRHACQNAAVKAAAPSVSTASRSSSRSHGSDSYLVIRDFKSPGNFTNVDEYNSSTPIDIYDDPLLQNDVLWFSGSANVVSDLRKIPGLVLYQSDELAKIQHKDYDRRLVQAVVARKGILVGKTVKELRFRTKYGAAVISINREGRRVHSHPGQEKLQGGDVLLLEAGPNFVKDHAESSHAFVLLSEVKDSSPPRLRHFVPAILITIAMLAVYTAGVLPLLVSSLLANMLMLIMGILSQQEARDAVNWEVFVTIASAFGIGTALTNSGVAGGIANGLVKFVEVTGLGAAGLYAAIYAATVLISSIVTNNAAAALVFPIAMDAADQTGADQRIMAYCLMLAASASFMSPFGYTTNL